MKVTITFDRLRWEEKALAAAAKSAGIDASLVDAKGLTFEVAKERPDLGDFVLQRCISHYRSLLLTQAMEAAGLRVMNTHAVAEVCSNKLATSIALSRAGVPTPRTFLALTSDQVESTADALGYPLVLKPFTGSWGRMVTIVRDKATLKALVEYKEELANPIEHMYYMQEYIQRPPRDIRAIVAGGNIIVCVHRHAPPGEWRTNVARGGTSEAFKPDEELREIILKGAEAVGGGILGVDAMEAGGGYLVHEVNNTVEFKGAQSAVEVDIPAQMIRYVADSAKR